MSSVSRTSALSSLRHPDIFTCNQPDAGGWWVVKGGVWGFVAVADEGLYQLVEATKGWLRQLGIA